MRFVKKIIEISEILPYSEREGSSFSFVAENDILLVEEDDIVKNIIQRDRFSHKGTFGHALLIAGSYKRAGAAILSAKAVLRSGAGLVSVSSSVENISILQTTVPEAMIETDLVGEIDFDKYAAIGIGPAWGIGESKVDDLAFCMKNAEKLGKGMVIDADAITVLAQHKELLNLLPKNCILTPHCGELKRLIGDWKTADERFEKQLNFSIQHNVIIVGKGAYTAITYPKKIDSKRGLVTFNTTGNSGMATAGSGDVLTGIILGLLAQGYSADCAAWIGTYIHGKSGDIAIKDKGETSLIAGDIVDYLPASFISVLQK